MASWRVHAHTLKWFVSEQAEAAMQKDRADALERERDMLLKQLSDLRDKLAKALSALEEVKGMLAHMVPR